ncbi:IucA/IucC family siderophore biosynthesis protein [Streptomyces sp. WMMB 322]|uniref:IucA/IucC family protein n=1 Tax=Streptomyces sp. WMMB 322 TaxID=1286821 RepID=UPI000823D06E|nr:IucA/IucC family protein [Streptomyces sp. WMMB 322]SCK49902.1 Siderophore synthetase component [Streptomyces sp. WMMB 322]
MNARTGADRSVPRELVTEQAGAPAPKPHTAPVPPTPSGSPVPSAASSGPAASVPAPPSSSVPAPPSSSGPPSPSSSVPSSAASSALLPGQAQGPGPAARPDGPASADAGPDVAARTADEAAVRNLLCCWVRENDITGPARGQDTLVLPMDATGVLLRVPVRYWSPTGRHDFGPPRLDGAPMGTAPLDAVVLAALIAREVVNRSGAEARDADPAASAAPGASVAPGASATQAGPVAYASAPAPGPASVPRPASISAPASLPTSASIDAADLVARVADSVRRATGFLAERSAAPQPPPGNGPFLDAEQSLVLGHPLHPAPKSRQGLSDEECRAYSPEMRASFPLHWIAVDESVVACDSAWTERGRTVGARQLAARLAGEALVSRLPAGTVPLPLHPWQARHLSHRPAVARLLADGLLHHVGEAGDAWHPTSSVRTVARPGGPAMLKLSLGLPITNSRRENLRKELLRGLEVHRLLRSGLGAQWRAVHPGFDIVRDPAWLGVDGPDGMPVPGLDTVVRHNPFRPSDDAVCVAGLTAEQPWPGVPRGALRSRLADVVENLAARTDRSVTTVATEWFLRYLDAVVRPVLWLDAHAGIALEAHQQNTLVLLDGAGWPCGGRYRDNQGYYFRESRRDALQQRLPGTRLGVDSDSFVDDAVTDERFAYYLGINNILGLVGAFGVQRLADEAVLLAAARQFLRMRARAAEGGPASALPALLLESPTLRCKANLLTRLHGMDELVGPVDTQSVYVTVTNPLCR